MRTTTIVLTALALLTVGGCTQEDKAQIRRDTDKAEAKLKKAGQELKQDLKTAERKIDEKTHQK